MLLGLAHRVFHEAKRRGHERKILVVRRDIAQKARKLLNRHEHDTLTELAARFGQCQNHRESLSLFVYLNHFFRWSSKEVSSGGLPRACCDASSAEVGHAIQMVYVA